ncbi:Folylpolyglutamate synthase [Novipirellula artificiosorum]|uniref:Dihydrofolate synthase/folylpolyglutamate synthase n=1 Tax=Novipirellula artificiosorum TaxID=2528016 RepID=A0A5C6DVM7_9BACT|nr:Folylpolyglutamate synthase [Novipirellula artificiosorum]
MRFLYDRINYEGAPSQGANYPFRLRRMRDLIRRLGLEAYLASDSSSSTPPPKPLVHIAGTKGKGSTASMVAAMLSAAGYRTGLYTSPHLTALEERFRIDSLPCRQVDLVQLVDRIRSVATAMDCDSELAPTFFELTTAIAVLHFHLQSCDAIVLETGLGGRLDSTNVFASSVTAITSIGLDHQHVLGNTIAEIASEKAGIMKPSVPVVSAVSRPEAVQTVHRKAAGMDLPLFQYGRDFDCDATPRPDWGSQFQYRGRTPPLRPNHQAPLALEGDHQANNAAVAVAIVDLLNAQGLPVSNDAVSRGLGNLTCEARIERFTLRQDVVAILDAAHNPDSIDALVQTLKPRLATRPITVVFATSRDKDAQTMLDWLSPLATHLILTRYVGNPRYREPSKLRAMVDESRIGKSGLESITVLEDPIEACEVGLAKATPGGAVVICGSFFLAAETRSWLQGKSKS